MVVFGGAGIAQSLIRERLVSSTAYADGCVTQLLRPA